MSRVGIPLIDRAPGHGQRTALLDDSGAYTYWQLLRASLLIAGRLLGDCSDLEEGRVCFLVPRGFDFARVLWGVWRAGGIAVPLSQRHTPAELAALIEDADAGILIAGRDQATVLQAIAVAQGRPLIVLDQPGDSPAPPRPRLPERDPARAGLILYTSGTTGRPKGVVHTHHNITAQITPLVEAWQWRQDDHIVLVLPLDHTHGLINVLCCALWAGALVEVLPVAAPEPIWRVLLRGGPNLLMAVPTIYHRLIAWYDAQPESRQRALGRAAARLRLMVSGSAALPLSVLQRWQEISGQVLLERYGMTEIGMALSNPLHGERRPGFVGQPLPGVEVRLVDEAGAPIAEADTDPGELLVRGPGVFTGGYWRRPEATAAAFRDGWFLTGDVARRERGSYRVLGRKSTDIIKTGGYKVSAHEIEEALRQHPQVRDLAVVGVADDEWGERVCAVFIPESSLAGSSPLREEELRHWARQRLAGYKVPSQLLAVSELPRNTMGKVNKPALRSLFSGFER